MDDRPLESPEAAIGRIDSKLADVESRLLARLSRRPTGDVELAFRATPKAGTLFMQGQPLSRTTYAGLWAWAQANGAVVTGGYGAGDGSTTFTVPNMQGRVLMGAGTLGADTYALGALTGVARHTLTTAEMPSHNHTPFNGSMTSAGGHNHVVGPVTGASANSAHGHAGTDGGLARTPHGELLGALDAVSNVAGGHSHAFSLEISNTGGGGAHENRQPSIAVNVAVWF